MIIQMMKQLTIVSQYPGVKLISLKENNINSYKKKAIETGIAAATGELIVTTDADCLSRKKLVANYCFHSTKKKMQFL